MKNHKKIKLLMILLMFTICITNVSADNEGNFNINEYKSCGPYKGCIGHYKYRFSIVTKNNQYTPVNGTKYYETGTWG